MSQRELDDVRFEEIVRELRETAPSAPGALRQHVLTRASLPEPTPSRPRLHWSKSLGYRRAAVLSAVGLLLVTLSAAAITNLNEDGPSRGGGQEAVGEVGSPRALSPSAGTPQRRDALKAWDAARAGTFSSQFGEEATALPPGRRLQDYDAQIRLRVKDAVDLDRATKQAMRDTRQLGGFVSSIDFGTRLGAEGDATLVLRVPIGRIQEAIARYSQLGTLVTQRVNVADLQPQADRLEQQIAQLRRRIAELVAKSRTPAEEAELDSARARLRSVTGSRVRLVREARYATATLELTTQEAATKREEPGRFGTFWDDASEILATEAVWLLYALVIVGPFALLAALALLAERARRRRADDGLLADH